MAPRVIFTTLMNGPNKLECYITLGWKGLHRTNTLAYSTYLPVTKETKTSEYGSFGRIQKFSFSS
jgi:hypothetical protein